MAEATTSDPLQPGVLHADLRLPHEPWIVGIGRHFTSQFAHQALGYSDALDDVEHCVSETLTNAIEHGQAGAEVFLRVIRDDAGLRVEVRSTLQPTGGRPELLETPLDDYGRGLFIVKALSTDWGWEKNHDGTITVWFEKARPSTDVPA